MSSDNLYILGDSGKLKKFSFNAHKLPEIKESPSKEYAIYGTDKDWRNKQPQYYNWLYSSSPKHTAIVNTKQRFVVGKGLDYVPSGLDQSRKIEAYRFVNRLNRDMIFQKIALDEILQGGFCVEMIPTNDGEGVYPYHIEFSNVRVSKKEYDKEGELKPKRYFYTSDWGNNPEQNKDWTEFDEFSFDLEKLDKNKRYLFYYKRYMPEEKQYPAPEYVGGVPYVAADIEVANFVYNNVANGFSAGFMVNFYNGEPTEEQKGEIESRFKALKHGSDNAGDPILSFNELESKGVEISPISPNGQDERYINLNKQIRDEIFTCHETDPILVFGLTGEGGMSNDAGEKRIAYEYFKSSYVEPKQRTFEMFFNAIAHYNEEEFIVCIKPLDQIKPELSESTMVQILERNELREIAGYDPIEEVETREEFSKEGWELFANCGLKDEECDFIEEVDEKILSIEDAKFQAQNHISKFATKKELGVLSLLNDGETPAKIKESMQLSTPDYNKINDSLRSEGLIDDDGVTSQGRDSIRREIPIVVYKYATRPDAPPLKTESRPFCANMLRLSKSVSWTLQDIQAISNREGRDVFRTRGGWYNNPDTGENQPFCRHYWVQRLVRLR